MKETFFELIQVSLGERLCLSKKPTSEDWCILYEMAEKQSLVGVCFAAIEKLHSQNQGPDRDTLMNWMGQTEYIKWRNILLNQLCVDIQDRFSL